MLGSWAGAAARFRGAFPSCAFFSRLVPRVPHRSDDAWLHWIFISDLNMKMVFYEKRTGRSRSGAGAIVTERRLHVYVFRLEVIAFSGRTPRRIGSRRIGKLPKQPLCRLSAMFVRKYYYKGWFLIPEASVSAAAHSRLLRPGAPRAPPRRVCAICFLNDLRGAAAGVVFNYTTYCDWWKRRFLPVRIWIPNRYPTRRKNPSQSSSESFIPPFFY